MSRWIGCATGIAAEILTLRHFCLIFLKTVLRNDRLQRIARPFAKTKVKNILQRYSFYRHRLSLL